MWWARCTVLAVAATAATVSISPAKRLLDLGGTFKCVGRSIGNDSVKVTCTSTVTRGNTIFDSVINYVVSGRGAKYYIGTHDKCHYRPADESSEEKANIPRCPGIPE